MRNLKAIVLMAIVSGSTFAGPFGLIRSRQSQTGNGVVQAGRSTVVGSGFSSAQGVANHMASILRIGHFGGNFGYEGVGCGSTPYQAEMNCCFRQRMQPREVGIAQGSNGMWYACCRY